jgi:hypothetical protein
MVVETRNHDVPLLESDTGMISGITLFISNRTPRTRDESGKAFEAINAVGVSYDVKEALDDEVSVHFAGKEARGLKEVLQLAAILEDFVLTASLKSMDSASSSGAPSEFAHKEVARLKAARYESVAQYRRILGFSPE